MLKHILIASLLAPITGVVSAELRDPTQPGNLAPAQASALLVDEIPLTVSEIWISDSRRRAIINGVTVKPGQQIDADTRILKIQPRYVVIKQRGESKKIYLVPSVKSR